MMHTEQNAVNQKAQADKANRNRVGIQRGWAQGPHCEFMWQDASVFPLAGFAPFHVCFLKWGKSS